MTPPWREPATTGTKIRAPQRACGVTGVTIDRRDAGSDTRRRRLHASYQTGRMDRMARGTFGEPPRTALGPVFAKRPRSSSPPPSGLANLSVAHPEIVKSVCAPSLFSLGLAAQWVEEGVHSISPKFETTGDDSPSREHEHERPSRRVSSSFSGAQAESARADASRHEASSSDTKAPSSGRSRRGWEAARFFDSQVGKHPGDDNCQWTWAMCDACKKWRRLAKSDLSLPEAWSCKLAGMTCDAPEERLKEGETQGGLIIGSYASYPETMADSAIAKAEGVSRTTIWRRRQKQLALEGGTLSGTKFRERNVKNARPRKVQRSESAEIN